MKTRRFFLFLLCLCTFVLAHATVYEVETVPSPKVKGQDFYVSNPDGVLSAETEATINALCTRLNTNTMVELAVVVLKQFNPGYGTTYGFAVDLFNHWGIGRAEKNTGVLLFMGSDIRQVRIVTGKGIEGVLTDAKCGELLDDNLDYFKKNQFDKGILHVCQDLEAYLMEEHNRSELLLGWAPYSTADSYLLMVYLMLGFIIMVLIAWYAYKHVQPKPGQTKAEIIEEGKGVRGCSGCLMFIFPIPLLFFYIYYRLASKHTKTIPLNCKRCGKAMDLITDDRLTAMLNKAQQKELELMSYEYTLWHCPMCGEEELIKHKGPHFSDYIECTHCHSKAGKLTDSTTLIYATTEHSGKRKNFYTCQCCGEKMETITIIPQKRESSFGGGSGSSSGGGGSWGGGSSSGGGAGRSF